jgi:hypothetical protein
MIIGITAGLLDGLGITMMRAGQTAMGAAWVILGLAIAVALYLRVRENRRETDTD